MPNVVVYAGIYHTSMDHARSHGACFEGNGHVVRVLNVSCRFVNTIVFRTTCATVALALRQLTTPFEGNGGGYGERFGR